MTQDNYILRIENLEKSFGDKKVLRGVNLNVPPKKVFGFVGKNGAGKTTTMKLVLGLMTANTGEIFVNGEKVTYGNTKTNRFIGYLPDVPEYYSFMTPKEYLSFCGEITKMDKKEIRTRSEELLKLVGLGEEKHRIKGFSRGMKQRLGIAQALLNRPKLLICDEPTSALDPLGRKEILDILVAAKEETTILFSTHILSDVEHICDEMALLNEGKIIMQGSIDEVKSKRRGNALEIQLERKEDSDSLYRFICEKTKAQKAGSAGKTERNGSNNIILKEASLLPYTLNFIADNNIPFIKIEKQESTLEDIFLEAIK
jgi:ABC-2 type transport system ATP-binding protein